MREEINTKIRELLDSAEQFTSYNIDFDYKLFFSEVSARKGGLIKSLVTRHITKFRSWREHNYKRIMLHNHLRLSQKLLVNLVNFFMKREIELLKPEGSLIFITSNKWMRAAYGKSTRAFFSSKTNPLTLIDFGNVQNFETATVDTNILQFEKRPNKFKTSGSRMENDFHPSINSIYKYIANRNAHYNFNSGDEWVVVDPLLLFIKRKIESLGIPLLEWNIEINYGIKTGLNAAFIIDDKVKQEIVRKNSNSIECLRPILRGRDIQKWQPAYNDLWLISTHNGVGTQSRIMVENYPAIKNWLDGHEPNLSKRYDMGATKYNLRDCAYWKEFSVPKILFPNMTKYLPFVYDKEINYFSNDKSFIITGENIEYLCCFLNSELFKGVFSDNFPELQGGTRELRKIFVEKIPVRQIGTKLNYFFESLIGYLTTLARMDRQSALYSFFDKLNDAIIYELYFPEEFKISGKEILRYLEGIKPISNEMNEEKKLAIIQSEFERLYDPNHPVRNAIETLDSVDEIRIIKEALK